MEATKTLTPGDLIQVNEEGPQHWFRVILVVDEVKPFGVQAYCTVPDALGNGPRDIPMRLEWQEFDDLGAKSLLVLKGVEE